MFYAPVWQHTDFHQQLMVLNVQVTASRSEACWGMDEQLSSLASLKVHIEHIQYMHAFMCIKTRYIHTHTHSWRHWMRGLTQVILAKTCHHQILHSQSANLSATLSDSLAHSDTWHECDSCLRCSLQHRSYTGKEPRYLHFCWLHSILMICVCVCVVLC